MKNSKQLRTWLDDMQLKHPLVIAGPCSAETEAQVLKIAHELKDSDVNYYRAGIWKPRTRPGNFEGVGALGLKWLQKVKAETGLKTATEVAAIFAAASDSVTVIGIAKTSDETDAEYKDKIKRNVEHLEIIKAYKKLDGTTSIWTSESFTAIDAAIVTGKKVYE